MTRTVGLDWGTLPNGYGWIFPKKDHLSVGVGGHFITCKKNKKTITKLSFII